MPILKSMLATTLCFFFLQSFSQTLSVTSEPNTNCGSPNGRASATVDGTTSDYSFKWFVGTTNSGTTISTSPSVSGRAAGTYTVEATQVSTGVMVGTITTLITDAITYPSATIQILSHVTSCPPVNGSLKANVPAPVTNYLFRWYAGSVASGPIIGSAQTASALKAGIYTVVVINKTSACQTIMSATVLDQRPTSATIQVLSHQTTCPANGFLRAIPPLGGNTYQWYKGDVATGTILSTSQILTNREAGTYTVRIGKTGSQCTNDITATILDQTPVGGATIEVSNYTSCTASDGFALVTVQGPASDFYIAWYRGSIVNGPPVSYGPMLAGALPDTYTALVHHNLSNCSKTFTVTIADEIVFPIVTLETAPNNMCTNPNGTVTANIDGNPLDYSVEWFEGVGIGGPLLGTGATLQNIIGGMYTARVTNNYSRCETTLSAVVADETAEPQVYLQASHVTSCTSPFGEIQALTSEDQAYYSYQWFNGPAPFTNYPISALPVLTAPAGVYTVVVTHRETGCQTITTGDIVDFRVVPAVSLMVTSQTSCDVPNGTVVAQVWGAPPLDFGYEWYEGVTVGTSPILSTSNSLTNVSAGIYTVLVTHQFSGCATVLSAEVPQECISPAAMSAEAKPGVTFYPNPTQNYLRIATGSGTGNVSLIDKDGKTIGQCSESSEVTFDLTGQPSGVYILKYTSGKTTKRYRIAKTQ
jgi:hypothetical protein